MSYEIGEVREFATGILSASPDFKLKMTKVRMETIQKIWNGVAWLERHEAEGLLRNIIKERHAWTSA